MTRRYQVGAGVNSRQMSLYSTDWNGARRDSRGFAAGRAPQILCTQDLEDNVADLTDRMIRAAKLDIHLYEEVEADKQATRQAMTAVILSRVAAHVEKSHV